MLTTQGDIDFNTSIPLSVNIQLQDSVSSGYKFENDYINKENPYLEVSYDIISGVQTSDGIKVNKVETIPAGTLVTYGADPTEYSKANDGPVMFYLDRRDSVGALANPTDGLYDTKYGYDLKEVAADYFNGETMSHPTDISLKLDFSKALAAFEAKEEQYYLRVRLLRANDPLFPNGGTEVEVMYVPLKFETSADYGLKLDVAPEALNKSLKDIDPNFFTVKPLDFTTFYSITDIKGDATQLRYTLDYRVENEDGTRSYVPYSGSDFTVIKSGISKGLNGLGTACFYTWSYKTDGDAALYTANATREVIDGTGNPATEVFATVTVSVNGDSITEVVVKDKDGAVTDAYAHLTDMIVQHNGVRYAELTASGAEQKAVVAAARAVIEGLRVAPAPADGKYTEEMSIGFNTGGEIRLGNYRLTAEILVNGVSVAKDFFIFNVNDNDLDSNIFNDGK